MSLFRMPILSAETGSRDGLGLQRRNLAVPCVSRRHACFVQYGIV